MIDKSKQYRTRDGREVRIYATDGSLERRVHGAWKDPDGDWILDSWYERGRHRVHSESQLDLFEVKPRIKRTVWVNVYRDHVGLVCESRKEADYVTGALSGMRIACVELTIDCEEGEGL